MNNRYSLLFCLPLVVLTGVIYLTIPIPPDVPANAINAVIGDQSYLQTFGSKPSKETAEAERIRIHLRYVEQLLRERPTGHLSPEERRSRTRNLDLLKAYYKAGQFPHNDGHPDQRRPTFIDKEGNICAVGYLIEQTAGRQVAVSVNEKFKYAYISQIKHPLFTQWVQTSGLTKKELAMIQPMYGSPSQTVRKKKNRNHIDIPMAVGSTFLTAGNLLYLSHDGNTPSPPATHWLGMAAGAGSVMLGAFNLANKQQTSTIMCGVIGSCIETVYTETNHLRSGVAAANIAVGLAGIIRSGYHLLKPRKERQRFSRTELAPTHVASSPILAVPPVPALQLRYHF